MLLTSDWRIDATKILTKREIAAVLADLHRKAPRSAGTRMNMVVFRLACCCGLRVSEISSLRLADVRVGIARPHLVIRPTIAKCGRGRKVPSWWDINLTMNTYTMLGVCDQAAAVEALPPIPTNSPVEAQVARATGTDGPTGGKESAKMVPMVVPSSAENGAKRLASGQLRIAPDCTGESAETRSTTRIENAKSSDEIGASCASSQRATSLCTQIPKEGLEPSRPCGHWILSPARLPFRHFGLLRPR